MIAAAFAFLSVATTFGHVEPAYSFRSRLTCVHRPDRRDRALRANSDEYVFLDGMQIVYSEDAPELVRLAAEDFCDFMIVSMGINTSARSETQKAKEGLIPAVRVRIDCGMKHGFDIEISGDGVFVAASDERMAAQALYRLEDRMNLRRGPFLRCGVERRRPLFRHRFVFSGFSNDIFPDAHLRQIAHHGFTGIEVWLKDYDIISQGVRQDVNDLIARAKRLGLDVHFHPRNRAFVHPDDPRAAAMYETAYGGITKYYPGASSVFFCGEVCEFPSRDPRCNGGNHLDRKAEDASKGLPYPGWFPCRDWADWVCAVKPILHRNAPGCRFVFSTYNWGFQDEKDRADLISRLPEGVTLVPTFEMFEKHVKCNGLVSPVADYSLAFPGPGKYFKSEAAQAKANGIELWSNCNSAGLTWDFGNIPYQPAPWQWKKRWDALKEANRKWGLSGLRESHEYGWYPSFIAELEKEYMTAGGEDFDTLVRAIAARDYGEENAEKALSAWRLWSRAAGDYVPTDENQYGPCRIGAAYPFNFFGRKLQNGWNPPADFPLDDGAEFRICHFDFTEPIGGLGANAVTLDESSERKEIELFESQAADYRAGAVLFGEIADSLAPGQRDEARRMAALGTYLGCACETAANLKKGRIAWRAGNRAAVVELARKEYANAASALAAVDADSRLGWLASSGYTGSRPQIEWKLRKMRELYGQALDGR